MRACAGWPEKPAADRKRRWERRIRSADLARACLHAMTVVGVALLLGVGLGMLVEP